MEEFWYKTDNKIIVFDCVWVFDPMVYPGPKFLISITKKLPPFFSEVRGCFFILCYHTKHLQQIHWIEKFCRMYGLAVSVAKLNICQILMRFSKQRRWIIPIVEMGYRSTLPSWRDLVSKTWPKPGMSFSSPKVKSNSFVEFQVGQLKIN